MRGAWAQGWGAEQPARSCRGEERRPPPQLPCREEGRAAPQACHHPAGLEAGGGHVPDVLPDSPKDGERSGLSDGLLGAR